MSTRGERLRRMKDEVALFHLPADDRDKNHKRYLSEASHYLRGVKDPLEVLRFLDALLSSSFARRPEQKQALSDVGEWLGTRLLREPRLERDTLAYELGWMERLVVIRVATVRDAHPQGPPRQAAKPMAGQSSGFRAKSGAMAAQFSGFRAKIEAIEKRRAAEAAVVPRRVKVEVAKEPVRVAPERLPEVLEAEFAGLDEARTARKKARERAKAGKPKKVVWLALKPVDGLLAGLAKGLVCTLDTSGCEAVFEDIAKRDGQPRAFWVAELRTEDGRIVVGRIELARP